MLALLLVLRFPTERLRALTEALLAPASLGLACTLGPAHLSRQGLLLDFVAWSQPGNPAPLLRIEGLRLRPRLDRSASGRLKLADWDATVYGSYFHGNIEFETRPRQFHLTARLEGLLLERAELVLDTLDRTASGLLHADISIILPVNQPTHYEAAVRLTLKDTHIALRHPLPGMKEVTLEGLESRWRLAEDRWLLEECAFRTGMGRGECGGSIRPLPPPAFGQLALRGKVFPPLAALTALAPARSWQIPGDGWTFSLDGTMELPNLKWN